MKKLAVGNPWIIGVVGAAHLALVVGIFQGCGTPRPMPVEPPPAPVMPPPVVPEPTAPLPPPLLVPPASSVPLPPPAAPPARELAPKEYTVQPGDSLSKIAARFGLSTRELAELNGIKDPNKVRAGQKLVLPGYAAPRADTPKPAARAPTARPPAAGEGEYVVQPGDSLSRIAARLGVTTQELADLNGINDPNTIRAGQKLAVPQGAAKPAPAPAAPPPPIVEPVIETPAPAPLPPAASAPLLPAPPPASAPTDSVAPPAAPPPTVTLGTGARKPVRYPVSQGEKLEEIAKTFMVTPESILKLNNLTDASEVRPGMMLLIPVEP